jgi:hypothetical protein
MFFIFFSSNTAPPASGTITKNSTTIIQNPKSAELAISLLLCSELVFYLSSDTRAAAPNH